MLEDTLQKIENKKYVTDEGSELKKYKDKVVSISILAALIIIVSCLSLYMIAYNAGYNNRNNFIENPSSGMASEQQVAECVLYSDQIIITQQNCDVPVDCAPNGICLEEYGKCAYFIN